MRKRFLNATYHSEAEDCDAARAMLELLGDPNTRLLTPAEFASLGKEFNEETASIGLAEPWTVRDEKTGALKVLHVIAGSPAFRMGVQPGDLIDEIDGEATRSMSRDKAFMQMAGRTGTLVQLNICRQGKRLRIGVTRELLTANTVTEIVVTKAGKRLGYMALSQFGRDSAQQVHNALTNILKGNVEGIALDLRNNPGGFVPASWEIAGFFLPRTQVLYHSIDRRGVAKEQWCAADSEADGRHRKRGHDKCS
jgi:carboxyl-terminal processing protease